MNRLVDFNPPEEVVKAAQLLVEYFDREHNTDEWKFMGVQNRTSDSFLAIPVVAWQNTGDKTWIVTNGPPDDENWLPLTYA